MPSVNKLINYNLSTTTERKGIVAGCPNPSFNPSASCGSNLLGYSVLSFSEDEQKWYPTNPDGFYTSSLDTAGTVTGSAYGLKVPDAITGCLFDAIYLSGSLTVPLSSPSVYLSAVTGTFTLSNTDTEGEYWYLGINVENSASIDLQVGYPGNGAQDFHYDTMTARNSLVGITLGNFISPFNRREVFLSISGSLYGVNPPYTNFSFPNSLGTTVTLSGVGIIRSFGTDTTGSVAQQTQYNCLYGSTPSK